MFPQAQVQSHYIVNVNLKDVTSAKTIWSVEMNLRPRYWKTFIVRGKLCCTSSNAIQLISCKLCNKQYVGSAFKDILKLGLEYIRVMS